MKYLAKRSLSVLIMTLAAIVSASAETGSVAQTSSPISLEQTVADALKTNPGLRWENLKMAIKKQDHDMSFNKLYPSLIVGAGVLQMNDTRLEEVPAYALQTVLPIVNVNPSPTNAGFNLNAQLVLSWATITAINQTAIDYDNSAISRVLAAPPAA